jgi:PAS domain S-box-containing protein
VPLGCYKIGRVACGEDPKFVTNDVTKDPAVHDHEWASNLGLVSFAGFRLLSADNNPIGVLALFRKQTIYPEEERLLQDLASTSSQVILTGMAEEALRESETRYRQFFATGPDAIFIFDANTRQFIDMNESALHLYGYAHEEFLKLKQGDITAEPQLSDATIKETLAAGKVIKIPSRYHKRKDGTVFPVEISGGTFPLAGRTVLFAAIRDISERKRAEEELARYRDHLEDLVKERTTDLSKANEQLTRLIDEHRRAEEELREREEFLSAIVENIPDMIFVKDAKELRFVRFNRAGEDLLGYSREDLIGRNDYDFFPSNEAEFFTAKDREVLCNGHLLDIPEETIQTRRKGRRTLHTKKIPIADKEGSFRYLLGISEDITERKQAEKALQASEQRYRQLLSSVTDYIFTIEIKNDMPVSTTHGQGCVAVTGYTPEDYARRPSLWYEMVHPEDHDAVIDHAETAIRGETKNPLEHRIIHRNGTTRWVRNTMVPRYDNSGRFIACDGLVSDITERRRAEEALLKSQESLQKSERELRTLAELLFSIQDQERSRISKELHDGLGQELTVLKIYLSSLQKKLREDQQPLIAECGFLLGYIDRSLENTRRICKDLGPHLLEELGLAASLELMFKEVCDMNNLVCSLEMEPIDYSLPRKTLMAIYRIVQEALTNIVKHSGATRTSFSINSRAGKLDFLINDNGRGFDIRSVDQQPASRRGMGLFAMAERARMVGGSLVIQSQKGAGTEVAFSIPIKQKGNP